MYAYIIQRLVDAIFNSTIYSKDTQLAAREAFQSGLAFKLDPQKKKEKKMNWIISSSCFLLLSVMRYCDRGPEVSSTHNRGPLTSRVRVRSVFGQ